MDIEHDWAADDDKAWVITLDDEGSAHRLMHEGGESLLLSGRLAGGSTV